MAVTSVTAIKAKGGVSAAGDRVWTVVYRVLTNDRNDGPLTVLSSTSLPSFLSQYEYGNEQDIGAYRTSYEADLVSEKDSLKAWNVTCVFSSVSTTYVGVRALVKPNSLWPDNPLLQVPEVSGDWLDMDEPVTVDKDGTPVVNSAKDRFDDLTKEVGFPTLVITKNYADLNFLTLQTYMHAVNSQTFWGLPARYWKLSRAPWRVLFYGPGYPYFQISYEFRARYGSWDFEPLDAGWRKVSGNTKVLCTDGKGMPLTRPAELDGTGAQLPDTADETDFVYCDGTVTGLGPFRVYEEADFAGLFIPVSKTEYFSLLTQ